MKDDLFLVVVVCVVLLLVSIPIGYWEGQESQVEQCEIMGGFMHDERVFVCQRVK